MPEILDCTIRDGSYVIDGNWSHDDVANITNSLAKAGFRYVETGNGIGLGAGKRGVNSICRDEDYISIAVAHKGEAKIGAFFIPGIGTKDDIKMLYDLGGEFIRIGTDVTASESALDYIEFAKSLGLEVGYNFMKSYVVSPYELCKRATIIAGAGADMISLVDSAGGMLPAEVGNYMGLMRQALNCRLGFHGHNNLLLANANSMEAINNGADIVDATLMGMGRGAGNAQTESMLVILEKMGYQTGIDPLQVSRISHDYVLPHTRELKGADGLQLVLGYAQFHDSYLGIVEKFSKQYKVDYFKLIIESSKINRENPSAELIEKIASQLSEGGRPEIFFPKFYHKEVK